MEEGVPLSLLGVLKCVSCLLLVIIFIQHLIPAILGSAHLVLRYAPCLCLAITTVLLFVTLGLSSFIKCVLIIIIGGGVIVLGFYTGQTYSSLE